MLQGRHSHPRVWEVLTRAADRERADVGRQGDLLRQIRIAADYATSFPGDVTEQARVAVATARAIIAALDQLG